MIKNYPEARDYIKGKGIENSEFRKYLDAFKSYPRSSFAIIKVGGESIQKSSSLKEVSLALSCLFHLGLYPAVVHGAGPQINDEYKKRNIKTETVDGLRVTPDMKPVLAGYENAHNALRSSIAGSGGKACSLKNAKVFFARKMPPKNGIDLGYVGEIISVDDIYIRKPAEVGFMPVAYPIGYGAGGALYNLNADHAVDALSLCLNPKKLILITEVGGVYKGDTLVSSISLNGIDELMGNGAVRDGMGIKLEIAKKILSRSGEVIQISSPENLVYELFTEEGRGTLIMR